MARRRQEGNLFFRLDVDFFSDRKVKILKARYGADGSCGTDTWTKVIEHMKANTK